MPTYDNGTMRMMHHIVTDTPHDGASQFALTSRSHDDHDGVLFLRSVADHFARFAAEKREDFAAHLRRKDKSECVKLRLISLWSAI